MNPTVLPIEWWQYGILFVIAYALWPWKIGL